MQRISKHVTGLRFKYTLDHTVLFRKRACVLSVGHTSFTRTPVTIKLCFERGIPMEEKRKEEYRGKEVKGTLDKKKEYYKGKEVKGKS